MRFFNFNGRIYEQGSEVITPGYRGLRYGDGLFETIKYKNGNIVLLDEHFARLWKGMQLLGFEIPRLFSPDMLQQQLTDLLKKNSDADARIRITIIRGEGGIFEGKNMPKYIIETQALPASNGEWNENGLQLLIYRDAQKMADTFAGCKHNNFLPYFMAAAFAKKNKANDAIVLNNNNRICESALANIFIIKDGQVSTPALSEGCIAGIMRKHVINELAAAYPVTETEITEQLMLSADEVFLTNSIFNLKWVASVNDKQYSSAISKSIFATLKNNPAIFC